MKPLNNSLEQVLKLNPVSYEKKQNIIASDYTTKENGFIEQELIKIFPDLVKEGTDKDKLLSVNYTSLIPVLTKAIQEQQKQIERLELLVEKLNKQHKK